MKRITLGLVALLVSIAAIAQQPLNVWIKVSPVVATNGIVAGTTNLPDGTLLSLSLAGPDYSTFNRDNCCFDAVVAVSHGAFGPVKITKDGVTPGPGSYRVIVVMRDWTMQPPNVVAVIGQDGSNLAGPLIDASAGSRNVDASIPVEVQ